MADEHIPPTAEERAGLYRSVLAQISEPVLVIADNASSEAQVRPLLPGAGPHKVLVTSRHTLAGLGARLVDVTVLDEEAAIDLLDVALRAARPDDDRIAGDQDAALGVARVCGGLPLALQITAALLNADPALSTGELAGQLSSTRRTDWRRCGMTTAAGRPGHRSLRRSSCPITGWMPGPRRCLGCCQSVWARMCLLVRPRCWPICRPARCAGCWLAWPPRT